MIIDAQKAPVVNSILVNWFRENKRDLPFRRERDPYKVWVSEIMAQQTQMNTLLPYYERFIDRFPEVSDLAKADLEEVLSLWEGLGYYSRAKNLKKAAEIIDREGFPDNYAGLLKLPGVGPYTAGAIASICFKQKVPAVDGNVLRVISRVYASGYSITENATKKAIARELEETMPEEAGEYNESLMELGALICTNKNPSCLICPLLKECSAYEEGLTDIIPVRSRALKKEEIYQEALIILDNEKKPLYVKRGATGLLSGLYGFPVNQSKSHHGLAAQELADSYKTGPIVYKGESKHVFTHKIWNTAVYVAAMTDKTDLSLFEREPGAVPTAFKKMLSLIG